ncbi:MAG TPA: M1 family metallopeptidase, partial [Phycisphaerales bacterium]|nr:M1 family metallopeptidase [Phycisphaerales bacterium]
MNRLAALLVMATALGGLFAPACLAEPGARAGQDPLSYPRHPLVDYRHMRLNILIPDMNTRKMEVVQDLTFMPPVGGIDQVTLDAKLMDIRSVECVSAPVAFDHDGQRLVVRFDRRIAEGESCTITTTYTVTDPPFGFVWTPESPSWPGRPAQVHSKGQPEYNSYWFPCHDFPNDRLTTEIIATVPGSFEVVSNGRLLSVENRAVTTAGDGSGAQPPSLGMYRRFHWLQDEPHVPYLVTLVVGRFDVEDVGTPRLAMPVYAPIGRRDDIRPNFGRTPEMIRAFEGFFGTPYPWHRYAQVMVHNYASGATENTSATSFVDTAIWSAEGRLDHDPEGLIAHELAHQWFGNLVTCRSWEHIWINEAWATYGEALWFGHRDGPSAYDAHILREFASVFSQDTGTAPDTPGMVSKKFRWPREVFSKSASPYAKGSSVLHMLRRRVGEEAFFRGTAEFLRRHRFDQVETSDFQAVMEEISGESLGLFFSQWCDRPGHPVVRATIEWDGSSSRLAISAEQTQTINGDNPAFEFDLPVAARMPDGSARGGTMLFRGRRASLNMDLAAPPAWVEIDPGMTVLANVTSVAPAEWLHRQSREGSSLSSRIQAIRSLAALKDEKTPGLCEVVVFDQAEHDVVKLEAVRALRRLSSVGVLETCVIGRPTSHAARESAVDALAHVASRRQGDAGDRGRARAAAMFARLYAVDPSPKVRSACLRGLGAVRSVEHLPLVLSAAATDSPGDRVRQGALRAIGDLGDAAGLAVALALAGESAHDRTRPFAFDAIVKLRRHDPDAAF